MSGERPNRYLRDIPLPGLGGPAGYRGPHVCEIVGISYRQLDYWTTTGLVSASVRGADGSGTQRLYSFEDIVQLKVIKRLLDTGVSLQRIRSALEFVRDRGLDLRNVTLMSDGTTVYAADDDARIVDLLRSGQGVFAIAVEPLAQETEGEVADLPREHAYEDPAVPSPPEVQSG
ncbi:MerR family transcriptional regulator [Egibacter rhizosphaerae]|uniref:MerR family transcriptional regulator n=1 Tax=Egibacter rhizosphaerae TaxID=1670831 RepID=A0A411YK63_9ACTN|nr:MerR family transcriptional regulator [Egibacter rhizosphaerae]QBI21609.1 MerR family transcriptional regulator [Egibacter rhizosphaerae]